MEALAAEKRWTLDKYRAAFAEAVTAGFVKYDERAQVIFLPHFLKWNPPHNPNVLTGWAWQFEEIPSSPLKGEFYRQLQASLGEFGKGFDKAFAKAWPQQMPRQPQRQGEGQGKEPTPISVQCTEAPEGTFRQPVPAGHRKKHEKMQTDYTPGFLSWWQTYPVDRRQSKSQCFAAWLHLGLEPRAAELVEKLVRLKQTQWDRADRQYIKTALPYLNSGRYDDDLVPLPGHTTRAAPMPRNAAIDIAAEACITRFEEKYLNGAAGLSHVYGVTEEVGTRLLSAPERYA